MSKIRLFGASSGYVEIAPAAAASNNTLTAPSTVGEIIAKDAAGAIGVTSIVTTNATITTAKVGAAVTISESGIEASGIGITCANINGGQISGRRNIIINGAMLVAQRGTSAASDGYGSLDRFSANLAGNDEIPTQSQADVASGTSPYAEGFRKCFRMTNGNQTGGADAADRVCILYTVEAQDLANSGWNYTSTSSFITISFWVKSSVAQNFYVLLRSRDGTERGYVFETGSLTADTWTKITKTVPGASNIQIDNNNGDGLQIEWQLFRGTDKTGSVTLNQWATFDGSARVPDMTSTWYTTNDATFEITGVQLEVGPQATSFEHHSFADELRLCQRYFQRVNGGLTGVGANATSIRSNYVPIVNFRASPTISANNPVSFNDPGIASPTQTSFDCGLQFTYTPTNIGMTLGFGNFPNNGQTAQGKPYIQWDSASDYIDFNADF